MHGSVHLKTFTKARGIRSLCLCAVAGAAILSFAAPATAQSNDVLNRLKRMENEIDTLNRAVYKGEKPPASAAGPDPAVANIEVRLGQIESDLRTLTGKVEQQGYDTQQLQQRLDALEQSTRTRLETLEGGGAPASRNAAPSAAAPGSLGGAADEPLGAPMADTNTIPPATLPADGTPAVLQPDAASSSDQITGDEGGPGASDAAGLYEQGFGEIKAGDFAAAEKSFTAFMKQYPDHALAPNALYWLGETYYARKDYDKASRAFAEAYQKYPDGPKGADNLLKLGLSLAGKGEKDNACIALGQLRKEYPKGPEPVLRRGEQEMQTLGCK